MSSTSDLSVSEHANTLANPYVVGRPLTRASAGLFVGREDVFAWLGENLTAGGLPNALLLYGERRIGKTSTLYQLVEGARGAPLRNNPARRLLPVYVDLQRLAGCQTDEWLRRLARDIYRQVAQRQRTRALPRSRAGADTGYAVFDRALDHLEEHLPAGDLILLAIDELEQMRAGIEAGLLDAAIAPYLRSQVQHRLRVAVIFSGSYGLLDAYWQPLIDLTARYELGPLDFAATTTLIRAPLAGVLTVDDAAVEHIWRYSGGRPFAIQTLCHRLVSRHHRQQRHDPIGNADVQAAIEEIAAESQAAGRAVPGESAAEVML